MQSIRRHARTITLLLSLAAGVAHAAGPACELRSVGARWEGPCNQQIDDERTALSIAPAAAITTGIWRREASPTAVWAGSLILGADLATPVELEVYADGRGALRTLVGWFEVSGFAPEPDVIRIDVDFEQEVAPSEVDHDIVVRAAEILSSAAVWNRADNRKCPPDATAWSIYCAMERATVEVAGAFHHRRPALEVVRRIVDERTAGRPYDHRLMDYNNDLSTHLDDVKSLFAEALGRIDQTPAAGR